MPSSLLRRISIACSLICSYEFLERLPLHRGSVAVVVKEDLVAAKLAGDDPPTAAENLKLPLALNADAKREGFHHPKRVINVSNWVTNDNEGPA
jgi:hypothetical protein